MNHPPTPFYLFSFFIYNNTIITLNVNLQYHTAENVKCIGWRDTFFYFKIVDHVFLQDDVFHNRCAD